MRIRVTRRAERQIDQILASLLAQSPSGATRVGRRLAAALELLAIHPQAGRMTDRPHVRRLVITPFPYLVFYRADPDAIVVLGFQHAARSPA